MQRNERMIHSHVDVRSKLPAPMNLRNNCKDLDLGNSCRAIPSKQGTYAYYTAALLTTRDDCHIEETAIWKSICLDSKELRTQT
mmetsp:Transcript_16969/g.41360  ORF Transcript_16969/g.41360 Transcript_16969/m.41360 type:complete len:84 (+) Transcript_16969:79-330(+)